VSFNCKCCGTLMKPLFTGTYCPNECDKPLPAPGHPPGRTPMPGPYGLAMFKQSWLWRQSGPMSRCLACPYCAIDGETRPLTCGVGRPDGTYDATCNCAPTLLAGAHAITVQDDETVIKSSSAWIIP
jgi:hypothetical protein